MSCTISQEEVERVGSALNAREQLLAERFRALFTLRGIGTPKAIDQISFAFSDPSALLKHECAYCLGQIQDSCANPYLVKVLRDRSQEPMVRHEAAEALGAIGGDCEIGGDLCSILKEFSIDECIEVAETCQIALARVKWLKDKDGGHFVDNNPYLSVDPAPPKMDGSVPEWKKQLNDVSLPLFDRYRVMFALRNQGGTDAVLALTSGFTDSSALFKHELAYILGQMQDSKAVPALTERLSDLTENSMVRHECAEALGSIATDECLDVLKKFKGDKERVVKESCDVAIDMYHYQKSGTFQYADTISKTVDHL